jgi:hypothetical protein
MGIDSTSTRPREDDAPAAADGADGSAERAGQRAVAEDAASQRRAEPRTRDQYAEAVRASGSPMQRDQGPGSGESPETGRSDESGTGAAQVADRQRAEPRDRVTYADDMRAGHGAAGDLDEADAPAGLAALDSSPAPGGHQADQAADEEAGDRPDGRSGPEQHDEVTFGAADTRASPAGRDSGPAEPVVRPDGPEQGDTADPRFSVVEAERTLGDTTPTGIGLKPTGDQLIGLEDDKPSHSRLDRFISKTFEDADDLHDGIGDLGEAVDSLRTAPTASGHSPSHDAYTVAVHDRPPPPPGPGVSDVVGSVAISAVAALAGVRHALSRLQKGA